MRKEQRFSLRFLVRLLIIDVFIADLLADNCKDEDGVVYSFEDDESWQASPCLECHCKERLLSCQRNVTVFFPGYRHGYAQLEETCHQPSCNVIKFIREKKNVCEGVEMTKNGGILMKDQTWSYKGCKLYFNGTNDGKDICPPMARPVCYVYNGSICCAAECAVLQEIANMLRGNLTLCPNGLQLVADVPRGNSTSRCLSDLTIQNYSSEISCQDEDSNKYFEGATWSFGDCIQCFCKNGKIYCMREISLITSLDGDKVIEHCNQPHCNVTRFLEENGGTCTACKWNGTLYFDGDNWKENGVTFYCSSSNKTLSPGCYPEGSRVKCTKDIAGIRNITFNYKDLYLCKSEDEIISINDRCDQYPGDCYDKSDEKNCDIYYCGSTRKLSYWLPRAPFGTRITRQCSSVDADWTGTFHHRCQWAMMPSSGTIMWEHKDFWCGCEKNKMVQYFQKKITEVNKANFLDITMELSDSIRNFTNKRVFFKLYKDLFDAVNRSLAPVTPENANLTIRFCQGILSYKKFTAAGDGFCHYSSDSLKKERVALFDLACNLFEEAAAVINDKSRCDGTGGPSFDFFPPRPSKVRISRNQLTKLYTHLNPKDQLDIHLNLASLGSLLPVYDVNVIPSSGSSSNSQNSTASTGRNTSRPTEDPKEPCIQMTKQQIEDIITKCKWRKDDNMITELQRFKECGSESQTISNPEVSEGALKQTEIWHHLELVLMCLSIAAVILSVTLLSLLRFNSAKAKMVTKHDRIFVHTNLLLSLGLGNLVYVLDDRLFMNRKEHPAVCSTVTVIQHYLHTALFTWMLVEGINLYIKLVKVFSVSKQYLTYVAVGWGIPAVTVGLVAAVEPSTYNMKKPVYEEVTCGSLKLSLTAERTRCWLNGNLWIYKGPVLAILLVNVVLFVILLRVIFGKLASRYGKTNLEITKRGLKGIVALLPLLGVTWLVGFFIELHEAFRYIFIVLNSTQGVVFCIFHCFLDDQVRDAIRNMFRKQQPGSQSTAMPPLAVKDVSAAKGTTETKECARTTTIASYKRGMCD